MFLKLITALFRPILTPPAAESTDAELHAAEREIELDDSLPEAVIRARSMLGLGLYCLGAGGKNPYHADPWSSCAKPTDPKHAKHVKQGRVFCDCSGFIDWCYRWSRNDPTYGWRYCDAFVRDALNDVPGDLGYAVPIEECQEGDLVVYKSVDTDRDGDRDLIGHVGIISKRGKTFREIRVIHCASRGAPYAVRESDGRIWETRGVVFRVRAQPPRTQPNLDR